MLADLFGLRTEGWALANRVIGRLIGRTTRAARIYEVSYDPATRTLDWLRKESEWGEQPRIAWMLPPPQPP